MVDKLTKLQKLIEEQLLDNEFHSDNEVRYLNKETHYNINEKVYFMFNNKIASSSITKIIIESEDIDLIKYNITGLNEVYYHKDLFLSVDSLVCKLIQNALNI